MAKKRKGLGKRYAHSEKTAGSNTGGVFNFKSDVKFFKAKEGKNKINIIPYVVKSKNHPLVKLGDMEIGDWDYVMDIWIHPSIGAGDKDIVCLKKNYGKKCPLCDASSEFADKGKEDEAKSLKAKRRVFYNIINERNIDGGLMVFQVSHYLFEKELIEEARSESADKQTMDFADIEDGKVISFRGSMTSMPNKKGKSEFLEFKSFRFEDREVEFDVDIVEDTISFDEIMEVLTYTEIEAIYLGEPDDDDDEEKMVKKEKVGKKKKQDDDDDDEPEEEELVKKKSSKKEESEEKKKGKSQECPKGFKFGKDCDKHDECDTCKIWDECSDASEEN